MAGRFFSPLFFTLLAAILGTVLSPGPLCAASPYLCSQNPTAKFIDGRINEWAEPHLCIDKWNWRSQPEAKPVYGGDCDLSATLRLAWDMDHLYLAVIVLDDFFVPAKTGPVDSGDAVVLTIAPAAVPPGTSVTPIEFAFTLSNVVLVFTRDAERQWAPCEGIRIGVGRSQLPAPETPLPREAGKGEAICLTKLCYELAIPWTLLPAITPKAGDAFGLFLQIPDTDDGKTVRGSLKWRGVRGVPLTATGYGQMRFGSLPVQ